MCVIRRHFLAAAVDPAVSLSMHSLLPMVSFVDHVDQAAPRAPGRWTTARPRRERHGAREYSAVVSHVEEYEGFLVRLPSLVWWGREACAAA